MKARKPAKHLKKAKKLEPKKPLDIPITKGTDAASGGILK